MFNTHWLIWKEEVGKESWDSLRSQGRWMPLPGMLRNQGCGPDKKKEKKKMAKLISLLMLSTVAKLAQATT